MNSDEPHPAPPDGAWVLMECEMGATDASDACGCMHAPGPKSAAWASMGAPPALVAAPEKSSPKAMALRASVGSAGNAHS